MQTHPAKRVEIIIELPMQQRLIDALIEAGVTGLTVLPVLGGSGRSGQWSHLGQVSSAGGMAAVICITSQDKVERLMQTTIGVLQRHIGVVSVSDCNVVRPERF